jgi:hypothetical protein
MLAKCEPNFGRERALVLAGASLESGAELERKRCSNARHPAAPIGSVLIAAVVPHSCPKRGGSRRNETRMSTNVSE